MIRICKNADKPQTLDKSYNTDEVCKQLLMDQNDKCYLCERRLTTDYQVEHFKSQANNGDLKQTWENLFVACGYCNNKKSNKYDDILDPTQYDIETIIEHSNDFVNQKAIFDSDNRTSEVLSTIKLLNLLFNGKLSYRNCREQRFYDEFIQKMNFFSYVVDEYMSGEKEYYYPVEFKKADGTVYKPTFEELFYDYDLALTKENGEAVDLEEAAFCSWDEECINEGQSQYNQVIVCIYDWENCKGELTLTLTHSKTGKSISRVLLVGEEQPIPTVTPTMTPTPTATPTVAPTTTPV